MTEIRNNNGPYVYQICDFEKKYTTQCSEVKAPSESSASLKELQFFLLTQRTVVQHPTKVHGIQWGNLNYEILRLATYCNYPTSATKSVLTLAIDVFFYIGDGSDDKVMCYVCCVTKNNWLASEDVSEVHKTLSISCSMVTGIESNNVPVKAGSETFEFLLNTLCVLYNDDGYLSVQTDAAPLPCHEQIHRQVDTRSNGLNDILEKGQTVPTIGVSFNNKSSSNRGTNGIPGYTKQTQFATSETATLTIPPSASEPISALTQINSQHRPSSKHTNNALSHDSPNSNNRNAPAPSGNLQANSTSNNITETSTNHVTANQIPKTSEPPKSHAGNSKGGKGPTYSELGIITERPKRTEYAMKLERIKTFANWPRTHHIKLEDLADAGFYYAGYGDCARCFFCGGGLRNWEDEDDVWVEHGRWFPKCAFIRQLMGQNFVDAVQEINKTEDKISFTMVIDKMGTSASDFLLGNKTNPLKRDPAVKAMIEFGYDEKEVLDTAAAFLKSQDVQLLAADVLLSKLKEGEKGAKQTSRHSSLKSAGSTPAENLELIHQIKEKNKMIRQQTMCKICMDKDVEVVFLPCGHLVSCAECASALNDCPVCRKPVKGTVRAFIG